MHRRQPRPHHGRHSPARTPRRDRQGGKGAAAHARRPPRARAAAEHAGPGATAAPNPALPAAPRVDWLSGAIAPPPRPERQAPGPVGRRGRPPAPLAVRWAPRRFWKDPGSRARPGRGEMSGLLHTTLSGLNSDSYCEISQYRDQHFRVRPAAGPEARG